MHIVHIITGLNNGGAEAVLYRLVTNDTKHKHVVVSLMGMGKYGPMLEEKGIEVVCLNMPQGKLTLGGVLTLWKTLRKHKPNVVQTWMYHADLVGGVIAKLAGIKQINWGIHHTDLVPGESSKATIFIAKLCAKLSNFIPSKIVCCAQRSAEVHSALGYNQSKMVVIGNGYELAKYVPNVELTKQLIDELSLPNFPVLGMVGRFDPLKNHENLLQALGLLKNKGYEFSCLLIGPNMDSNNQALGQWITDNMLSENVILLGQRPDIPAIMNTLDVHLLSSVSEAFPNVLAEAMACGTPCVTTNVGDAAVIVDNTGWVVPPKNPIALAEGIEEALLEMQNQPQTWQERQHNCRKHIEENFSIEIMIYKYHDVWNS